MKSVSLLTVCLAATLVGLGFSSSSRGEEWADLKATFVVKGTVPAPAPVNGVNDPFCTQFKIFTETLVVDKATGGIKNLALYADPKKLDMAKINPAAGAANTKARLVLDNKQCRFEPHVLVIRPGQTLEVTNSDKTGHNANFGFLENEPSNNQIPAGGSKKVAISKAEPAPIPVDCGSHNWMKAHVIVQDHPYVGVTDDKGQLEIKGLPTGKISIKIWQECGKFKELTINKKSVEIKKGAFEIELKPGLNDLGTITLDAKDFKP